MNLCFFCLVLKQLRVVVVVNDPYAKLCVPDVVKNVNVGAFSLMSGTNKTRHIEWHKTCKFKCRLDATLEWRLMQVWMRIDW